MSVSAVGENASIPEEIQENETSSLWSAWGLLSQAAAYRHSMGNIRLPGGITINWREVPCVLCLAIAVGRCAISVLFLSIPSTTTLLLTLSSATGIYHIRESMGLRSLGTQIYQLQLTISQLEQLRMKYEVQGASVECTLKELAELEIRFLEIKAALEQTAQLLGEREAEHKALNDDLRALYEKYAALLTAPKTVSS